MAAAFTGAERARPPVGAGGRPARDSATGPGCALQAPAASPATYVLLASFIGLVAALSIWLSPPVSASVGGSFDAFNYNAAAKTSRKAPAAARLLQERHRASLNLANDVSAQVDDATPRASRGELRFPGHDGKPYLDTDETLPPARGLHRMDSGGLGLQAWCKPRDHRWRSPSPDAIYYWDHVNPPVQIGP